VAPESLARVLTREGEVIRRFAWFKSIYDSNCCYCGSTQIQENSAAPREDKGFGIRKLRLVGTRDT